MEEQNKSQYDILLDYLDGRLSEADKKAFELSMQSSPVLRKMVDEQRLLESSLKSIRLEEPSAAFTQKVMEKIQEAPQTHMLSIRNGIFLLAGMIIVSLIAAYLVRSGFFDSTGTLNLTNENSLLSRYIKNPLPSVPINSKFIINGIIILNLALGFIILDRAVLRPFFEKRRRDHGIIDIGGMKVG
jgi:hypothetical protein